MFITHTLRGRLVSRTLLAVFVVFAIPTALLLAHDEEDHEAAEIYTGPGWTLGGGGPVPIEFASKGVHLLAWLPITEFGDFNAASDCWGYTSPSGREYAIIGLSGGTAFIEITNPAMPAIIAVIPGPTSTWRDMKVYQHHAYAVSEGGGGVQVMDLTQIDNGIVNYLGNVTEAGTIENPATHNVAIDETSGFLYRCGGGSGTTIGLRIYSLADPANPVFVGEWNDRYVHDAQIITYVQGPYAGRQIAFCAANNVSGGGNPRLDIVDVTDKSNPFLLGSATYSFRAFAHQNWLTHDLRYVYLNDELAEIEYDISTTTRVFDVSDPENPFEAATFTNGNTSSGHNLYTRGDLSFHSNYQSGLRVFDISDQLAPIEVGFFDTWPEDDNTGFNGLWSNYPYFPSGVIIGCDRQKGLFVWGLGDPPLQFSYPNGVPETISPSGDSVIVRIEAAEGVSVAPGSAKLHYKLSDDDDFTDIELAPLEPNSEEYIAHLPALECAAPLNFYVSAQAIGSSLSVVLRDPPAAPASTYSAFAAVEVQESFADDFDEDLGWTIGAFNDDATAGIWERVDPVGTSAQPGAPVTGSACYVTGQHTGGGAGASDVDGGKTTLISPHLSTGALDEATISYWRWYSNSAGAGANDDVFVVDISSDGGHTWVNLETIGPAGPDTSGGWRFARFRVSDFVEPTDQVRVRFIASDFDPPSLVEAAIDAVRVSDYDCTEPCPADLIQDGSIGIPDLLALLSQWGACPAENPCAADLDGNDSVGVSDLLLMLENWGMCP